MKSTDVSRVREALNLPHFSWILGELDGYIDNGRTVDTLRPSLSEKPEAGVYLEPNVLLRDYYKEGAKRHYSTSKPFSDEEIAAITLDAVEQVFAYAPRMAGEIVKFTLTQISKVEFVDNSGAEGLKIDVPLAIQLENVASKIAPIIDRLKRE